MQTPPGPGGNHPAGTKPSSQAEKAGQLLGGLQLAPSYVMHDNSTPSAQSQASQCQLPTTRLTSG